MKDFQDIEFSKPDSSNFEPKGMNLVKKMKDVHEIALFILTASYQREEVIKEIFSDDMGREVAYIVYILKQPLATIDKITKLQRDYVIYTYTHIPQIIAGKAKEKKYSVSGETMTMEEFKERFGYVDNS
jgi:hypothetical protein